MDFINVDIIEARKKFTLSKLKINKDDFVVYKSNDGIVSIKNDLNKSREQEKKEQPQIINTKPMKAFESYRVKKTDTIKSIVNYAIGKYTNLRKFYNQTQLMNEIIKENVLLHGDIDLQKRNYIKIPYYIEPNIEYLEEQDDYIDYKVPVGLQYYYLIVIKVFETTDPDEIDVLVKELQKINGNDNPIVGSTIKIPNPETYFENKSDIKMK